MGRQAAASPCNTAFRAGFRARLSSTSYLQWRYGRGSHDMPPVPAIFIMILIFPLLSSEHNRNLRSSRIVIFTMGLQCECYSSTTKKHGKCTNLWKPIHAYPPMTFPPCLAKYNKNKSLDSFRRSVHNKKKTKKKHDGILFRVQEYGQTLVSGQCIENPKPHTLDILNKKYMMSTYHVAYYLFMIHCVQCNAINGTWARNNTFIYMFGMNAKQTNLEHHNLCTKKTKKKRHQRKYKLHLTQRDHQIHTPKLFCFICNCFFLHQQHQSNQH